MDKIDVFISRKSEDAVFAKPIYQYLTNKGLVVFESDQSLQKLGSADYTKAIDEMLSKTTHMIVVSSSTEYIKSSWVEAEWLFFLNRKRSGKTLGNLFTVIAGDMKLEDLPPSLANYEVIPYNKKNFPVIYNYVRQANAQPIPVPDRIYPKQKERKAYWIIIVALLMALLGTLLYFALQPYDASIFLQEDKELHLSQNYPKFEGGELIMIVGNKEERKQVLPKVEAVFKQLPINSKGDRVFIRLNSKNWKLNTDSIILGKTIDISIVPDGSLSKITGNITTENNNPIDSVEIAIDNDTTITSNKNGIFNIVLPFKFQKETYSLKFSKKGFKTKSEFYYPKSGNIDIEMKKE